MPTIRLGAPGAIEQPKRYRGALNEPTIEIRSWRGTKAAILALITQATNGGYTWTLEENGPNAVIEMEVPIIVGGGDPTSDVLVSSWELLPGETECDFLASSDVTGITTAEVENISTAIQTGQKPSPALTGGAIGVYRLMRAGVKSVVQFAPVLRHTQTVSNLYAVQASQSNVRAILSSAKLISNENPPAGFVVALDSAFFTQSVTRTDLSLSYGWLKKMPTLQQTYGSRLNITQEWAFGLWSTQIYGNPL